jgi:DNA-binding XRE family transcriptional regulator
MCGGNTPPNIFPQKPAQPRKICYDACMPVTNTEIAAQLRRPHYELNRLRRTARWSHEALAEKADISPETAQRIELGITANPWEETKHKIVDALNVRFAELHERELIEHPMPKVTVFSLWP